MAWSAPAPMGLRTHSPRFRPGRRAISTTFSSARVEPSGTGTPGFGSQSAAPGLFASRFDDPWKIDLTNATMGPRSGYALFAGNSTMLAIRNFDDHEYLLHGVAGPLFVVPPGRAVTVDLSDLRGHGDAAHVFIGGAPFGRMSVSFDLSAMTPLPPMDAYSDPTVPSVALRQDRYEPISGYIDESFTVQTLDIQAWNDDNDGTLRRNAAPDDVTMLTQSLDWFGNGFFDEILALESAEQHRTPDRFDSLPLPSGGEWRVALWTPGDRPSTALACLVGSDDIVYARIILVAAPDEFELFVEELLWQAVDIFRFIAD